MPANRRADRCGSTLRAPRERAAFALAFASLDFFQRAALARKHVRSGVATSVGGRRRKKAEPSLDLHARCSILFAGVLPVICLRATNRAVAIAFRDKNAETRNGSSMYRPIKIPDEISPENKWKLCTARARARARVVCVGIPAVQFSALTGPRPVPRPALRSGPFSTGAADPVAFN